MDTCEALTVAGIVVWGAMYMVTLALLLLLISATVMGPS